MLNTGSTDSTGLRTRSPCGAVAASDGSSQARQSWAQLLLSCCPGARPKGRDGEDAVPAPKAVSVGKSGPSAALPLAAPGLRAAGTGRGLGRGHRGLATAAAHAQDPAQLVVQHLLEARWKGQALQCVPGVGPELAQAVAAQVLQGGGTGTGADDLHAALGRRGAHHRVELPVPQLGGRHSWRRGHSLKPGLRGSPATWTSCSNRGLGPCAVPLSGDPGTLRLLSSTAFRKCLEPLSLGPFTLPAGM